MTEEQKKRADKIQEELRKVDDSINKLIGYRWYYAKKRKSFIKRIFIRPCDDKFSEIYLPKKFTNEVAELLLGYQKELEDEFKKL